jgi:hypothetical protein
MSAGRGSSMIKLSLSASLLGWFVMALGTRAAHAQSPDGAAPDGGPSPAAAEAAPPPPAAAASAPAPERQGAGTPSPPASDLDAKAAAEAAAMQNDATTVAAAGDDVEHSRLSLYGFADFSYQQLINVAGSTDTTSFAVGNLNLYMASELGDNWRSLIEVRFMYLPNGAAAPGSGIFGQRIDTTISDSTDFGRPLQWGGIQIERAWLERTFHKLLTVRVGHWLTPYGIWNVDHGSPVVIPVSRPFIIGEALFPQSQTGVEVYGAADVHTFQLGYHLTLSNGRGPVSTIQDLDNNKAVGGRLFVRDDSPFGTVTLGGSFYRGRYTNSHFDIGAMGPMTVIDAQYDELSLSADLKWQWDGLLVQGEAIENEAAFVNGGRTVSTVPGVPPSFDADYRRWGAYGLAGYRFGFLGVMPFGTLGYYKEGSPSQIPKVWDYTLGLNVRPTPRVVLKLQWTFAHLYLSPPVDLKIVTFQSAWSF